ncbi:MAG: hypothetical protein AB4063_14915 [Crocosphaera sp.]
MFNIGQAIDVFSDVTGNKERTARLIKFFEYKEGGLGIAFFDNQTVHGEYWLGNIPVSKEYETIFKNRALHHCGMIVNFASSETPNVKGKFFVYFCKSSLDNATPQLSHCLTRS